MNKKSEILSLDAGDNQNEKIYSPPIVKKDLIEVKNIDNCTKTSIQTQTSTLVDSGVQTTLDSIDTHKRRSQKSSLPNDISSENDSERIEIPTRDNFKQARSREKSNEKRKIFSSSPKRVSVMHQVSSTESITSESSKSGTKSGGVGVNSSVDLTRISATNEHFIATGPSPGFRVTHPRVSRSPVSFVRQDKFAKNSSTKQMSKEKQSTASTLTSTIVSSSVCSTITNVTLPPNNASSKNFSSANVQSNECEKLSDFDKSLTTYNKTKSSKERSLTIQSDSNKLYDFNLDDGTDDEMSTDTSIFENDEILQILFKKTYFYQSKLK
jgi:hypothetical protein